MADAIIALAMPDWLAGDPEFRRLYDTDPMVGAILSGYRYAVWFDASTPDHLARVLWEGLKAMAGSRAELVASLIRIHEQMPRTFVMPAGRVVNPKGEGG